MKKEEVKITDLLNDWNDQNDKKFTDMVKIMGVTFNDYLIFIADKYTILPK